MRARIRAVAAALAITGCRVPSSETSADEVAPPDTAKTLGQAARTGSAVGYRAPQPDPVAEPADSGPVRWSYFPDGDELYDVSLAPDGDRIALVQRVHWPDGAEVRYYESAVFEKLKARARHEPRFNDPRVLVISQRSSVPEEIDFGFEPTFSPDGARLAYARQAQPLTARDDSAATLAGNAIGVVDLATHATTEWGRPPAEHHFANPLWATNTTVIAEDCSSVPGADMSRCAGLAVLQRDTAPRILELGGGSTEVYSTARGPLLAVTDAEDGGKLWSLDGGHVRQVAVLRPRGEHEAPIPSVVIGVERNDVLLLERGHWITVDLQSGRRRDRGAAPTGSAHLIVPSPDGTLVAYHAGLWGSTKDPSVYLVRRGEATGQTFWTGAGTPQHISWAPDSKRLALIVSRFGARDPELHFAGDELLVLDVERIAP